MPEEGIMRRRLYFLLPDVDSARRTANDLLIARVEDRRMRFLAKRGTDLGELPEAGYLYKTDLVHGAGVGLMLGATVGMIVGALIVAYPPEGLRPQLVAVLIGLLVGGLLGAWMASMAGGAVPQSRPQQVHSESDRRQIPPIVHVPAPPIPEIPHVGGSPPPEAPPP